MSDSRDDRVAQYLDDQQELLAALLDRDAHIVISNAIRFGRGHGRDATGALGPVEWEAADQAADDIIAELAKSSMTVTRPRLLSRRTVDDELLPAARAAWADAGGAADPDAGLRAVVAELTLLIAWQLGRSAGRMAAARRRA